ncbi:MAG TPA: UpxY family transcription antiterminator [Terriglobales bacterium]|jgi:transcription antitermination factor NusG
MPNVNLDASSQWHAAYTITRHEKRVFAQLKEKQIDAFLPLCRVTHRWKNRTTVVVELPLFPGYLFVRIPRRNKVDVLSTPGVVSLVGSRGQPWPLSDFEIETLRTGLDHRNAQPHPYLVVGERARIRKGPLSGMEGVLVNIKNRWRVVLTINEIAHSFSVEVDSDDIERIYTKTNSSAIA